jgi:hypothetical protein
MKIEKKIAQDSSKIIRSLAQKMAYFPFAIDAYL